MNTIILLAVVLCASQLAESKNIESFWRSTRAGTGCTVNGPACLDCSNAITCVDIGNGNWVTEIVDTCERSEGKSCLNGVCTTIPNPKCGVVPAVRFPCTAVGMFPDPLDCQTFHTCCDEDSKSDGHRCPPGHAYDPISTFCRTKLVSDVCPKIPPVPECTAAGTIGPVVLNPSIYYICSNVIDRNGKKVLYPILHACPNGGTFAAGKCTEK